MRLLEPGFEKLLLICTHERLDGRTCCAQRGSVEVHAKLKQWIKDHGLAARVRVSRSGCLDRCAQGVTLVVLPDFRWYGGVTTGDVDQFISEHLQALVPSKEITDKESS